MTAPRHREAEAELRPPRAPQAAPTRAPATATAAGRAPGTAAPGARRASPATRTRVAATATTSVAPTARRPAPTTRTAPRARVTAGVATATATSARPAAARPAAARAATTRTATTRTATTRTATRPRATAPAATRVRATAPAATRTAPRARATAPTAAATGAAATARPLVQAQPQPGTAPVRRTPLRIVGPPDPEARSRHRRRLWVGALAGLACAGLFAIVGVRVLLAQGQGPVDALESQVTAAQAESQRLRLDVARLESPSRIVAEAKARLGMVTPAAVVYLPPLEAPLTQPAG